MQNIQSLSACCLVPLQICTMRQTWGHGPCLGQDGL